MEAAIRFAALCYLFAALGAPVIYWLQEIWRMRVHSQQMFQPAIPQSGKKKHKKAKKG